MKNLFLIAVLLLILLLGKAIHSSFFPKPPCPENMNTLIFKNGEILCIVPENKINRRNWQPYDPKIKPGKQT